MPIRPIDYINVISKSQEVTRIRHNENEKANIQFQQGIINQKKHIEAELNRIKKTNKNEYKIIDSHGSKEESSSNNKNKKKYKKGKNKGSVDAGANIDIKI